MLLLSSNFKKNFRNTINMSNGLNPDQEQGSIGPDLGFVCLFDLILYDPSTVFQLNKDGSS